MKILKFNEMVNERNDLEKNLFKITNIKKTIEVELDVQHSVHSIERTRRHDDGEKFISNDDIKAVVTDATEQIISSIIENKLNVGDAVLITRKSDWLNIVGSLKLKEANNDTIIFKVITVMKEEKFRNIKKTYQIFI
jgi:superfamily I DNA and RNA helicase